MSEPRILTLGGVKPNERRINLREICPEWTGCVSDEARAEIEANRCRAFRVIQTADQFWFR